MEKKRCIFCMHEMDNDSKRCPKCRKGAWEYQWNSRWLRPYTRLNERYMIGIALGEGAAGITYLAYDMQEEVMVAVKEYYPDGKVRREPETQDVTGCGEQADKEFQNGLSQYQNGALRLVGKRKIPGLVEEKEFFTAHGTGYIVMEYLSGQSLKSFIKKSRQIQPGQAAGMLKPVMEALLYLHSEGMIHCDISPDNLLFDQEGELKLIDLGAARQKGETGAERQLKEGYASPELYQEKEKIGPWTDLYALCAVWYEMMTGKKVPAAPERLKKDTLKPPSELVKIVPELEQALMQGLSLDIQRRYFSVENLMQRSSISCEEAGQLSGDIRREWGELWIRFTTQVEQMRGKKKGHLRLRRWLKRGLVVCLTLMAVLAAAGGSLWLYCRRYPEKVVEYELRKDRKEAERTDGKEAEDIDAPEYKADLAFIKANAATVNDEPETFTTYQITRKTAKEWGKPGNWNEKFYLKADTMKKALEVWKCGAEVEVQDPNFTGSVMVRKTQKKEMKIDLSLKESYVYGETRITVTSDYNDHRITQVSFEGFKEELFSFLSDLLPVISPESYLAKDEIEELLQYEKESETGSASVKINAKCWISISLYGEEEDKEAKYLLTVSPL